MCGRYHFMFTPGMQALFSALGIDANPGDLPNLAPTDAVPIIFEQQGKRECHMARWWLTPSWSRGPDTRFSMFNARAENLDSSRAFKGPFHHKRCVVPVSAFIEWQTGKSGKQPIEIQRENDKPLLLAGLWDIWNDELVSCTIITTPAAPQLEPIHQRMPVMLSDEDLVPWLDVSTPVEQLTPCFTSTLHHTLSATPVSLAVNNARHKARPEAIDAAMLLHGDNTTDK